MLTRIWGRHPSNERVNALHTEGSRLLERKRLQAALERFQEAVKLDPLFAESWNKVATVLFLQQKCARGPLALLLLAPLLALVVKHSQFLGLASEQMLDVLTQIRGALTVQPALLRASSRLV